MEKPQLYVIAGPNGAGKTTFATKYLPGIVQCKQFLNADLIAAGLSPFSPESQNILAGRLLLQRIRELSNQRANFGFETTLSGRSYASLFNSLQSMGYHISLFFLWLPSDDVAVSRVANRVRQGGHNIQEIDVRRRFRLGLSNLVKLYSPLINSWVLYDSTCTPPLEIARGSNPGSTSVIRNQSRYELFQRTIEALR